MIFRIRQWTVSEFLFIIYLLLGNTLLVGLYLSSICVSTTLYCMVFRAFSREKSLYEEKVKAREELARQREETARRLEVECEQRIRNEVEKYDELWKF